MRSRISTVVFLTVAVLTVSACKTNSGVAQLLDDTLNTDMSPIDYSKMDASAALEKKAALMQKYTRGKVEQEILHVCKETLKWGRANGKWNDVNIEDLMAHARQESNIVIDWLDQGKDIGPLGAIGKGVWDYHSIPGQDITGSISFSVWQAVEVEYLVSGRKYDPEMEAVYNEYIVKYAFDGNPNPDQKTKDIAPWRYKDKIVAKEGQVKGKQIIDALTAKITRIVSNNPSLHVKITADLLAEHYHNHGAHSPNAIRSYFMLSIQKGLDPKNWLEPVRFDDDIPPSAKNGYKDNNVMKRGDYGKQVMMGSTYNDRGMIFWYGATRDQATIKDIVNLWNKDPARLTKGDYQWMKSEGYLKFADEHPQVFTSIVDQLPN